MATLQLGSDTLAATPAAGQVEYNGTIQTFTPLGTQRGVIPAEQFFSLNTALVGANATGAQNIFGVGVTLSASTIYEFELNFVLAKTAGTTSHTVSFGFGGTATINNIYYVAGAGQNSSAVLPIAPATGLTTQFGVTNSTAVIALTTAITSAASNAGGIIKGLVSINAGGTFTPQYTLSAAPAGAYSTLVGSYMKIKPIGVAGSNVSVGTWA